MHYESIANLAWNNKQGKFPGDYLGIYLRNKTSELSPPLALAGIYQTKMSCEGSTEGAENQAAKKAAEAATSELDPEPERYAIIFLLVHEAM